ncbi:MAG: hypothetical protein K2G60_03430 [Oscillospiraceae bacterium]|nr:hypothetical protein [Oscillospiraceae bacterium]
MSEPNAEKTKVDKKRLSVLTKVIESGRSDDKAILAITSREMTSLCKDMNEMSELLDLQDAIKAGKVIQYLAGKSLK